MMVVFDLAYLLRGVLCWVILPNAYIDPNNEMSQEKRYLWTMIPGIFYDCVPILAVMWLHHQNYKNNDI